MTFLRRLFGKDINLEEFERLRCDACDGTGKAKRLSGKHVFYSTITPCGKCHGKGWLLVKRAEAEEGGRS